ncbi:Xaa-Pro aminopeptidase [Lactobacillus colini]|uniref:Xaa-Pro aminopeptidase n=1 Tax=Lactobacillus colini TaxID=1819254 RepID=A0ABS4MEW5_9LACO|nr:aminopeptidase P family protein [Lactobacillus colini]MBP2058218.1 Xaa-Pro aminopeptidase [Lactobacillus colini]
MENNRINNLRKIMKDHDWDAFLVTSRANRYYISNFTGTYGRVLIDANNQYIIADGRYFTQIKKQAPDFAVVNDELLLSESIANLIKKNGYRTLAIESTEMNVDQYLKIKAINNINIVPTQDIIESLRMHKDNSERSKIEKADEIADKAFEHIKEFIRPGLTEREVANELDNYGLKLGASTRAFETIVASGYRSAMPHGHASNKVIENNELIVIDFGFQYDKYYSDVTRTVALGKVDSKLYDIYEIDKEAQQAAIDSCEIGKPLVEIDAAARNVINKYGYGEYFLHGLGHGLGLSVHEYPLLNQNSKAKMEERMTFTTEPGIYIEGLGGVRIEDNIFMSEEDKPIRMTKSSREWYQL